LEFPLFYNTDNTSTNAPNTTDLSGVRQPAHRHITGRFKLGTSSMTQHFAGHIKEISL